MELKRHLDWRNVFVGLYVLLFAIYLVVGLQPAKAADLMITNKLVIPGIELSSDVASLSLENSELNTPDEIVGSYSKHSNKTLLIGHSTTVFSGLHDAQIGDVIVYDKKVYHITSKYVQAKDGISMTNLLKEEERDTLVLMTCAGELLGNGDATHRLIIFASA